jgi:diadenosine tetraphosphate (Ap4A) HIT family hydrolase
MSTPDFTLDPRLVKDTVPITPLKICQVLLMQDCSYPWLILVPNIPGLRDLDELDTAQRNQVMAEVDLVSKTLKTLFAPDKINVANLGNIVEQLHIHIIARFKTDPAWPAPVWGKHPPVAYEAQALDALVEKLRTALTMA